MNLTKTLISDIKNVQSKAGLVAVIAAIISAIGFFIDRSAFASSYLTSYLFWIGLTVGCFPMIMVHSLTSGGWGYPVRRFMEMGIKNLPAMALLLLPIILCMHELFEWTHADVVAHDPILQQKEPYLNVPFFIGRAVFYFAVWFILSFLFRKWAKNFDDTGEQKYFDLLQGLGGLGLILYGLTVTFSSVDWAMSLEPHWFSTIYGLIFMVGNGLAGLAFAIAVSVWFSREKPMQDLLTKSRSHDLGNLLFAFVMLWAYVAVSQFIIIWSGNLAEEAPWYLIRFSGNWYYWILVVILFHFVVPFFLLLMRETKRNFKTLGIVAAVVFFMRWLDLAWYVKPVFYEKLNIHWLDFSTFLAMGGLWIYLFAASTLKEPIHFKHDPERKKK